MSVHIKLYFNYAFFAILPSNLNNENRIIEMLICNTIRKGIISLLLYNPKLKYATMTCTSDT